MPIGSSERTDLPLAVVIGGGATGMAAARTLGRRYRVILASQSADRNPARETALREDGIDATAVQCDITDPVSVDALVAFAAQRGPLRVLAHVAALSPSMGDWRRVLDVNLVGAALIERAMLSIAQMDTAAIFISSLAAYGLPLPDAAILAVLDDPLASDVSARLEELVPERTSMAAYRLSKLALNRLVQRRASAWGHRGARIVSLSPGLIATPMGAREFAGDNRAAKLALLNATPVGREGTLPEIADAIDFLASQRASFITGTDLLVDGGAAAAMKFPAEQWAAPEHGYGRAGESKAMSETKS